MKNNKRITGWDERFNDIVTFPHGFTDDDLNDLILLKLYKFENLLERYHVSDIYELENILGLFNQLQDIVTSDDSNFDFISELQNYINKKTSQ